MLGAPIFIAISRKPFRWNAPITRNQRRGNVCGTLRGARPCDRYFWINRGAIRLIILAQPVPYQLDFVTPGSNPCCAISRMAFRHRPKSRK